MHEGKIQQIGSPNEIFERPCSAFVADFMGFSTFIQGTIGPEEGEKRPVSCSGKLLYVPSAAAEGIEAGSPVTLAVRSENIQLVAEEGENTLPGTISAVTYKGTTTRLEVTGCVAETVCPAVNEYTQRQLGEAVLVHIPAQRICVYKNV